MKDNISNVLTRCVFELRALQIEGEYPGEPSDMNLSDSARYALSFIVSSPMEKLFTFKVSDEVLSEIALVVRLFRKRFIDRKLLSMEMLSAFDACL